MPHYSFNHVVTKSRICPKAKALTYQINCTWIKDASYYIGIYNTETKDKIAEIPTVIEGGLNQTANMHYGESKGYTINGCYILDIKKNEKDIYITRILRR